MTCFLSGLRCQVSETWTRDTYNLVVILETNSLLERLSCARHLEVRFLDGKCLAKKASRGDTGKQPTCVRGI